MAEQATENVGNAPQRLLKPDRFQINYVRASQTAEEVAVGQKRRTSGANARCGEVARRILNHLRPD